MEYLDSKVINRTDKTLSVKLKKTKEKGISLFATKIINKGETIAFYKIKVFLTRTYDSPTNYVYYFEIYRKNGEAYKRLVGDIDADSFPEPIDGISFLAPFANEPSESQRVNAEIDINLKENYIGKTFLQPGDVLVYKLVASKKIRPGEEILWYYGKDYNRNYKVGKKY
tara:strand:- start:2905 stop:3411 length:507 start_codon:yes stop_codon:yes gene_type:complete